MIFTIMQFLKNMFLLGAAAVAFTAVAEETTVYDLRLRDNFVINNQFSVDKDEEPWLWGPYNIGGTDYSGPEQYNSSYTDGYYSSAFYTPDLPLEAGTYKVYTRPRKRNSDYATPQNPDLRILLGQGEMTEAAYNAGKMKEVGRVSDIQYASTYSTDAFQALPLREITFTVETPGNYKIAFFNKGASVVLHETYIVSVADGGGSVTPDPGTDPDDPKVDPDDPDDPNVDPDDPDNPDNPDNPYDPDDPDGPLAEVNLPFADSFAGGSFGTLWEVDEVSGEAGWVAQGALTNQLPLLDVFDADGGMAVFKGWDGKAGDYARLATAPITKASSSAPVVEFQFGHSGARATNDKVRLQVQKDGGDWQDVEGAVIATYIPEIENGGWTLYKFPIEAYIDGCTTYRVGFLGFCETSLNANIPIDDVKIYNAASRDVSLVGFSVPEEVSAGKDIELSVEIENLGASALPASAYTVEVETDFPGEVVVPVVDIPAYSSAVLTGMVATTAEAVLNGPEYEFSVKVNVPGNASGESFTSDKMETAVVFVDHKQPLNPAADYGEGGLTLSWESVKDLDHKALNIAETFNGLEARHQEERINDEGKSETYWVEGAKGNFNGFVSLDFDKQDGGSYYSTSGSEFQVFKDFMTGSRPSGHSGQYIGLTLPANIQQDDWLISPALEAAETAIISYQAKIAYIGRESDSYNNSVEVLYATEDYDPRNPADAFKKVIYSNTSKASSGDLPHDGLFHWLRLNEVPAEAKYVALHFITKSGMQTGVWIDLISISEKDLYPLEGYYVYKRNVGRLNDSPLAPEQLEFVVPDAKEQADLYYVTALYADGESQPCNFHGSSSSIGTLLDNLYGSGTDSPDSGPVRYYNLQGLEIDRPTHGIFIQVSGSHSRIIHLP